MSFFPREGDMGSAPHISDTKALKAYMQQRITRNDNGCWEWNGTYRGKGYGVMAVGGIQGGVYTHRLSAHLYHDFELDSDRYVLHRCDNPRCCNPEHLFIGTAKDNLYDCIAKGRFSVANRARGERVNTAKLTADDVRAIRQAANQGATFKGLSRQYGVSDVNIRMIVTRRTWRHVEA